MTNIIEQILEIDTIAQKKLHEAEEILELYRLEIENDTAANKAEIEAATQNTLEEIKSDAAKKIAEESKIIDAETDKQIKRLEDIYQKNRSRLEDEMYHNIIG